MDSVASCERCDSKIVEQSHSRNRPVQFFRHTGSKSVDTDELKLCSMCLDDVWEFVFEEEIDRSEKADPIPVQKMARGVELHINDLESVLEAIQEEADD